MNNKKETEILRILLKQFYIAWTITALAKEISVSRVGIWKILKRLEVKKLIAMSKTGEGKTSTSLIRLNWGNPILEKYTSLILTEDALKNQRWLSNFAELKDKLDFLILYGSILHSQKEANDIDILAITSNKNHFQQIEKVMQKIQKTQIKKIHLEILTPAEFKSEIKKPNKAFIDAIKKGVVLFGQEKFIKFIKEAS